jgi:CO dehydrogenase maturation factor
MKIAVTGKGGAGKSTMAALIARVCRERHHNVVIIDADPDMNLPTLFDIPATARVTPIVQMKQLIAERTGTVPGEPAPFFTMNPRVDDLPERFWVDSHGVKLLVMGTIYKGGGGCACPENAFLKSFLSHMMVGREEWVILDMEAGIEHLGRGTALGVDVMLVVVEPNKTSAETAHRISGLAADLGIRAVRVAGNKVRGEGDRKLIRAQCEGLEILGFIDQSEDLLRLSTGEVALQAVNGVALRQVHDLVTRLEQT